MKKYKIFNAVDGILILAVIFLDEEQVENLSDETTEGFFLASKIPALVERGVSPTKWVYALGA